MKYFEVWTWILKSFAPNLSFQNWNGTENIHALLNAFISSICGGFAAMILLIQLAQVLVSTFTFATKKIPGNSDMVVYLSSLVTFDNHISAKVVKNQPKKFGIAKHKIFTCLGGGTLYCTVMINLSQMFSIDQHMWEEFILVAWMLTDILWFHLISARK